MQTVLDRHVPRYEADWWHTGEPFLTRQGRLIEAARGAIGAVTGLAPEHFTGGGTSDARFLAPLGAEVVEIGPVARQHPQDRRARQVEDLEPLSAIYQQTLELSARPVKAAAAARQDFEPSWWLAHPQLQSVLATKSPRRRQWLRRGSRMEAVAQMQVLDCGEGVRLAGWHSRPSPAAAALVVLIHGWEGSHESAYLYSMACRLYADHWSVFRLNLRDHGGTHALNPELFHSARMGEVLGAVRAARALDPAGPLAVVGFSLGGNFALRVGLQGPATGVVPALSIGICPSINPGATLQAIDDGPTIFRRYFLDKWRKTLRAKEQGCAPRPSTTSAPTPAAPEGDRFLSRPRAASSPTSPATRTARPIWPAIR